MTNISHSFSTCNTLRKRRASAVLQNLEVGLPSTCGPWQESDCQCYIVPATYAFFQDLGLGHEDLDVALGDLVADAMLRLVVEQVRLTPEEPLRFVVGVQYVRGVVHTERDGQKFGEELLRPSDKSAITVDVAQ